MAMATDHADSSNEIHHRRGSRLSNRGGKDVVGLEDGEVASADNLLEAMGYQPELLRSRSTLQVAFMSFVLASIPYGLATTMFYPLVGGGPANIIWG